MGWGVTRLLSCGRYGLKSFHFGTASSYNNLFLSALINCMYCITRRGRGWVGGWRGWPDSVTLWTLWTQSLHFVTAVSFLGKENQKTTKQANKSIIKKHHFKIKPPSMTSQINCRCLKAVWTTPFVKKKRKASRFWNNSQEKQLVRSDLNKPIFLTGQF